MSADDRLSPYPFGPVECGNGIVEGSDFADICPQPTIPDSLDDLTQLGAIGHHDEIAACGSGRSTSFAPAVPAACPSQQSPSSATSLSVYLHFFIS